MQDRSVHDSNVYAYAVLCEQRRIVLHTEYRDGGAEEYTDVLFDGVIAHHFDDVLDGNILFDIEEEDPQKIVMDWADLFAHRKTYGWPKVQYADPQELVAILRRDGVRAYEIGSSYGLTGRVLAAKLDLLARPSRVRE